METTKDKPVIKALPEDFKKFVECLNSKENKWRYIAGLNVWVSHDTDEIKTTDELYQFYLLGK